MYHKRNRYIIAVLPMEKDNKYTYRLMSGRTYYYLNGKLIAKRLIPAEEVKNATLVENPPDKKKSPKSGKTEKNDKKSEKSEKSAKPPRKGGIDDPDSDSYIPGYSYLKGSFSNAKKCYYFNGRRVKKADIPKDELPNIKNMQEEWDKKWKKGYEEAREYYRRVYEENKRKYEEDRRRSAENSSNSSNSSNGSSSSQPEEPAPKWKKGQELLDEYGIKNKKDWKMWLLKNHPDKNKEVDIDLVARINAEAEKIYRRN